MIIIRIHYRKLILILKELLDFTQENRKWDFDGSKLIRVTFRLEI